MGLPVSEITWQMSLSVKKLGTHRWRVLEKTGMVNNAQLARYTIKRKLVE